MTVTSSWNPPAKASQFFGRNLDQICSIVAYFSANLGLKNFAADGEGQAQPFMAIVEDRGWELS